MPLAATVGRMAPRPLGHPTRGKTARGRLRRVDAFVGLYDPGLVTRRDGPWRRALFVDLGYGAEPWTTLESAARLRRLNSTLPVLGVELDPERVAAAQPFADEGTEFRLGGFNLPLRVDGDQPERVRLIRAFNVLRQYDASEVSEALAILGRQLLPGGLIIEGTADPTGGRWVADLWRRPAEGSIRERPGSAPSATRPSAAEEKARPGAAAVETGLVLEGVVFSASRRSPFDPADFQPVLPKRLIHRLAPGEDVHEFFAAWRAAWRVALPEQVWGPRRLFVATAEGFVAAGGPVWAPRRLTRRGYLVWRPEKPVVGRADAADPGLEAEPAGRSPPRRATP